MFCCGGMGFLGLFSMLIGAVLFLALIALAIWALLRWLSGRASGPSRPTEASPFEDASAREILEQRYARGEIDQATFERMREHLQAPQRTNSSPHSDPH
jgi:putative membrane protein